MRNRQHLEEVPLKRWRGANNLPGATSHKPGWHDPTMALAKIIAWQYAVEQAGSEDVLVARTDWRRFGITAARLLKTVQRLLLDFDAVWDEQRPHQAGNEKAKANALFNRLWHMYREREKGKGPRRAIKRITVEHPQRSLKLRPLVSKGIEIYHTQIPHRTKLT